MTTTTKPQILSALRRFVASRPGLDFRNYGDRTSYSAEVRSITKDLHHARQLLRYVELRDSITAEMILDAAQHAFSGRLTLTPRDDGSITIDYCTGQYYPTEYRRAVCAVLASAIWTWWREHCMPEPTIAPRKSDPDRTDRLYNGKSAGDYLRSTARREFDRGIQSRWFS